MLRGRLRGALALVALVAPVGLAGCAAPEPQPHRSLEPLWHQFQALPLKRALAVAGDPARTHWVAAMAGGAVDQQEAIDAALGRCRQKRRERRMRAPCLIYAVDDEIVWMTR